MLRHGLDFRYGSPKHGLLKHGHRTASTTNPLGGCKHRHVAKVTGGEIPSASDKGVVYGQVVDAWQETIADDSAIDHSP
jgi:hypothetical protein